MTIHHTVRGVVCPSCAGPKDPGNRLRHYLCEYCWDALTEVTRESIDRQDDDAGVTRLLELKTQLEAHVRMDEIRVTT